MGLTSGYRDASKRTYIVGEPIDNVMVFDSSGRFVRRIGRSGSGPGEFEDGASLVVTGDGEFSVLDRRRSVILNFDYTGRLRSEVRTVGEWYPRGVRTYPLGGVLDAACVQSLHTGAGWVSAPSHQCRDPERSAVPSVR